MHVALPTLAPIAGFLVLLELAAGTAAAAYLVDGIGRVGRGFLGTTAVICAGVMGIAVVLGANLPTGVQLLHGALDPVALAGLVHWCLGFMGALLAFAFFCSVGTDAARRVVGAATLVVAAVTIAQAAIVVGPALGGAGAAAVIFVPATLVEGGALAGMLLGHWYLVSPALSFRPLRQAINILFAALAVELVTIAIALGLTTSSTRGQLLAGQYAVPFWLLVIGSGIVFTGTILLLTRHFA
ncbi:MAG TPA: hypothetical protein VEY89_07635, partial [Candidatus Dormibacteraeota bacterium]|nr:hypothetical protein [Candidatus Dormibacteraeota bacterium]